MSNKKIVHVTHNSGNNEWYTPPDIIEAARQTMGSIDVDPASCKEANKVVNAAKYYTVETNGLTQRWEGNVWLNPPYNKSITEFIRALYCKVGNGEVCQACVLTNNATETAWFRGLLSMANALCFLKRRVKFITPSGKGGSPLQGQIVTYIGKRGCRFSDVFGEFGRVLVV